MNDNFRIKITKKGEPLFDELCSSWIAVEGGIMVTVLRGPVHQFNWDGLMRVEITTPERRWVINTNPEG